MIAVKSRALLGVLELPLPDGLAMDLRHEWAADQAHPGEGQDRLVLHPEGAALIRAELAPHRPRRPVRDHGVGLA